MRSRRQEDKRAQREGEKRGCLHRRTARLRLLVTLAVFASVLCLALLTATDSPDLALGVLGAVAAGIATHRTLARALGGTRTDGEEGLPSRPAPPARNAEDDSDGAEVPLSLAPEPDAAEGLAARPTGFDLDAFSSRILATEDPVAELRLFVGEMRRREQEEGAALLGLERFASRVLEEAGLFAKDVELPPFTIVKPRLSGMFYLRSREQSMPYLAKVRIISLEAALNAIRYAATYFSDDPTVSMERCYQLNQDLQSSICAQLPGIDEPRELGEGDEGDGEWAVRKHVSMMVESLQLPYRLELSFRSNVSDGNLSFQLDLTPEQAFPASMHIEGLGMVASTRQMRRKAASAYALRLAIALAAVGFSASSKLQHVWVAGTVDTPTRHWCQYSIDFDRGRFSQLDLSHVADLERALHPFVPNLRLEDGILKPVEQGFSLEEPRFCPPWRHAMVSLSSRRLGKAQARALGCERVSGLAIEEADKRAVVAADIMRRLTEGSDDHACEKNVRVILQATGDDPDPSVREAGLRTSRLLIDGTLPEDALLVGEEFVAGDPLSRAARRGREALGRNDPKAAVDACRRVLSEFDAHGSFADGPGMEWRYFGNYVDRALYNRMFAETGSSVMLVPNSYFECHLIISVAELMLRHAESACTHARRCMELAPLDRRAHLHLVRCLEEAGREDEAREQLVRLLNEAHDPEALGFGYYRMAYFQWQRGNILAAEACYHCALRFLPPSMTQAGAELMALAAQHPETYHEHMDGEEIAQVLEDAGVPVAPTEEMFDLFMDCARASLDAEVFPVARNFISILGAFNADDVVFGILRSMEGEPDA